MMTTTSGPSVLPNMGFTQLFAAVPAAPWYGIVIVDIDHLWRCNHVLGHMAGDEAIRQVSERLARYEVDLAVHVGADIWVLAVGGAFEGQLRARTRELGVDVARAVDDVYALPERWPLTVTTAFAVGEDLEQVLPRADLALFAGRNIARNRAASEDDIDDNWPNRDRANSEVLRDPPLTTTTFVVELPYAASWQRRVGDWVWCTVVGEVVARVREVTGHTPATRIEHDGAASRRFTIMNESTCANDEALEQLRLETNRIGHQLFARLAEPLAVLEPFDDGRLEVSVSVNLNAGRGRHFNPGTTRQAPLIGFAPAMPLARHPSTAHDRDRRFGEVRLPHTALVHATVTPRVPLGRAEDYLSDVLLDRLHEPDGHEVFAFRERQVAIVVRATNDRELRARLDAAAQFLLARLSPPIPPEAFPRVTETTFAVSEPIDVDVSIHTLAWSEYLPTGGTGVPSPA